MRKTEIARKTAETDIHLLLDLDGKGRHDIETGCGFLDHMLELFARHGSFDLKIRCKGDVQVDYHHTTEDIAITLGMAFDKILADRRGINRYGSMIMPMDETLVIAAVDISGRGVLNFDVEIPSMKIGDFDSELVEEFMAGFARTLGAAVHFKQLAGGNSHHVAEGVFKGFARAMAEAVAIDPEHANEIPSSKGLI